MSLYHAGITGFTIYCSEKTELRQSLKTELKLRGSAGNDELQCVGVGKTIFV